MQTYRDSVKFEFEKLDSENLAARIRTGGLTDIANAVAVDILQSRGFPVPAASDGPVEVRGVTRTSIMVRVWMFVIRCLRGKESLAAAYWYLGAIMAAFGILMLVLYEMLRTSPQLGFVGDILLVLWIFGSLVHGIAVWRCAKNARIYVFGQLAKFSVGLNLGVWFILLPIGIILELLGKT
jgi:hypothetical protein